MYRLVFITIGFFIVLFGYVLNVSATYSAQTSTPTPNNQGLSRRSELLTEIQSKLGFTHPVFDEIVKNLVKEEQDNQPPYIENFIRDIDTLEYGGTTYIAVVTAYSYMPNERFWLFQLEQGQPILREDATGFVPLMQYFDFALSESAIAGFADRNQNGLPDLAVYAWNTHGSTCCPGTLVLLEFKENGEIINIAPQSQEVYVTGFEDLDGNEILEITGYDTICLPHYDCRANSLVRWWQWNGTAYVDITASQEEFYRPAIDIALQNSANHNGCYVPYEMERGFAKEDPGGIYTALLSYYALNRLMEGWAELYRAFWWNCTYEQLLAIEPTVSEIAAWVNEVYESNNIHGH